MQRERDGHRSWAQTCVGAQVLRMLQFHTPSCLARGHPSKPPWALFHRECLPQRWRFCLDYPHPTPGCLALGPSSAPIPSFLLTCSREHSCLKRLNLCHHHTGVPRLHLGSWLAWPGGEHCGLLEEWINGWKHLFISLLPTLPSFFLLLCLINKKTK